MVRLFHKVWVREQVPGTVFFWYCALASSMSSDLGIAVLCFLVRWEPQKYNKQCYT